MVQLSQTYTTDETAKWLVVLSHSCHGNAQIDEVTLHWTEWVAKQMTHHTYTVQPTLSPALNRLASVACKFSSYHNTLVGWTSEWVAGKTSWSLINSYYTWAR